MLRPTTSVLPALLSLHRRTVLTALTLCACVLAAQQRHLPPSEHFGSKQPEPLQSSVSEGLMRTAEELVPQFYLFPPLQSEKARNCQGDETNKYQMMGETEN